MSTQLKDLDVDRTDAVDDPASGRTWLILKSEDGGDAKAKLEQITGVVKTAGEALVALAKTEIELPAEVAAQLTDLAKSLELDDTVVFKSAKAADEPEVDDKQVIRPAEVGEMIFKAVAEALPGALKAIAEEERAEIAKKRGEQAPASRQPDEQDVLVEKQTGSAKFGAGMFTDVVFSD